MCTARQHHQRTQHFLHFLTTKCPHQPTWNLLFFLNVHETAVGSSVWILLKYWVAAFIQKLCLMTDDRVLFLMVSGFKLIFCWMVNQSTALSTTYLACPFIVCRQMRLRSPKLLSSCSGMMNLKQKSRCVSGR